MARLCRERPAESVMVAVFCVTFRFLLVVYRGNFFRTFLRTIYDTRFIFLLSNCVPAL